ncbi:MAG: hypothetical protein AABW80_01390 [Nanoarchaeota archaeon]
MKATAISFIFIFFISFANALIISEVESNPPGADSGEEWIELYSEFTVNLNAYFLENEDGDIINLSGNIERYLIVQLEKQWIDNSDAVIYIKNASGIVHQTSSLDDAKNDNLTWNFCNEAWVFEQETKNSENSCGENSVFNPPSNVSEEETSQETEEDQGSNEGSAGNPEDNVVLPSPNSTREVSTQKTPEQEEDNGVILLNSKNSEKKEAKTLTFTSKEARMRLWISYAFAAFCIIVIIFLSRKRL